MRIIKASVTRIEDFRKDAMKEALLMMGFDYIDMNFYRRIDSIKDDSQLIMYVNMYDDSILLTVYEDAKELEVKEFKAPIRFIDYVEDLLTSYDIESIDAEEVDTLQGIFAAKFNKQDKKRSSKDITKDLIRVKSSNLWSYIFQPRDNNIGTLYIQFKGRGGGPGDVYAYYDVPSKLWRRFVSAQSKGHFFWEFIRNVFKYSKLTGDKRAKLANGIN
jgi:hypothetical protein